MMGIMVPETCWASNKICNKKHLFHLVGILFPYITKLFTVAMSALTSFICNKHFGPKTQFFSVYYHCNMIHCIFSYYYISWFSTFIINK
jgi:hypothetical protein